MTIYEIFILVRPEINQDSAKILVNRIANVGKNEDNTLIGISHLGIFNLAYEIKGYNKARIFLVRIEHNSAGINKEIARLGKINSNILRLYTLKIAGKIVNERIAKVEKKTQKILEAGKIAIRPKIFAVGRPRSPRGSHRKNQ